MSGVIRNSMPPDFCPDYCNYVVTESSMSCMDESSMSCMYESSMSCIYESSMSCMYDFVRVSLQHVSFYAVHLNSD